VKHKICFIGPVNIGKYPQGGDQYKNQLLVNELKITSNLDVIDTVTWKTNPIVWIRLITNLLFHKKYDYVNVSASTNSALKIIKLSSYIPNLIPKINYWVIGGMLHKVLEKDSGLVQILKDVQKIVVETDVMFRALNRLELKQTIRIPNFKDFSLVNLNNRVIKENGQTLKLVFLSRICPEKGVDVILETAKMFHSNEIEIHFFGPIQNNYKEQFQLEVSQLSFVKYHGMLNLQDDMENSLNLLSEFDVFLFPTYWVSEGHPGALIDALAAGLAIVASDWNSNDEFINSNGQLIEVNNAVALTNAIKFYIQNPHILFEHKRNSLQMANQYHISNIAPQYLTSLN
jgi:glycosyltransferase involved in cell wall biosynthesis